MKRYTIFTPEHEEVFSGYALFSFRGWEITLHRFVGADAPGCFHTHPAKTFRFILWGGYVEEIPVPDDTDWDVFMRDDDTLDYSFELDQLTVKRTWKPFQFGIVQPWFEHRVDALRRKSSWTLWVRSPATHKISTRGC